MARVVVLLTVCASSACSTHAPLVRTETASRVAPASAVVGPLGATFVFPAETAGRTMVWPTPGPDMEDGAPTDIWEITWVPASPGTDVEALWLIVPRRLEAPREHALADVVARARVEALTLCVSCDGPAFGPEEFPGLTAAVRGANVVVTVRGGDLVRRIFTVVPDSVTYTRRFSYPQAGERSVTLAVRRR